MRHIEVSENQDNPRNVKLPKLITINYLNHEISFGHLINHTSFHKIWKVKSFAQLFWESSGNRYILHFERFAFLHFELFAGSFLAFCLGCIRVLAAANGFEKPREVLITSRFSQLKSYQQVWALHEHWAAKRDVSYTAIFFISVIPTHIYNSLLLLSSCLYIHCQNEQILCTLFNCLHIVQAILRTSWDENDRWSIPAPFVPPCNWKT